MLTLLLELFGVVTLPPSSFLAAHPLAIFRMLCIDALWQSGDTGLVLIAIVERWDDSPLPFTRLQGPL